MRRSQIPCFGCEHGKDYPKTCRSACERWKEYEKAQQQEQQDHADKWAFNNMMNEIEGQRIEMYRRRKSRKDNRKT